MAEDFKGYDDMTAHQTMECDKCARRIQMGSPYLRVRVRRADSFGVLIEVRRYKCCPFCRVAEDEERAG